MKQNIYRNILVIVSGFLILYLIFKVNYLLYISIGIGIAGSLIPVMAKYINWVWLKLAFILGWINSRILLSVIYFIFLTPIALISRLFTGDPLNLKRQNKSLFHNRDHIYDKNDLENIW